MIFVIGIPLIGIAKRHLRKLFDRTEFDVGIENFMFRIAGVAMWAIVILTGRCALQKAAGVNRTGRCVRARVCLPRPRSVPQV